MFKFLFAISLAFLFCAFSYSQEHPKAETRKTDPFAKTVKAGTEHNPIVVKVVPADDAKEKALEAEHHRKEKANEDW